MASSRVIGLDIGTSAVRAAEVEFGSGRGGARSASLVRYGQVALPPSVVRDGEVADTVVVSRAIKELWAKTKFSSKDVVIGVGNQRVVVRPLDLPWMTPAQLKESLPFQVQELLPVNIDDALLDFCITGEGTGPQGRVVKGMLVAAQRDTVSANVLAVESAGLRPTMVDLNGFALLRGLARGDLAERTIAFVDIGARFTNVVISERGLPALVRIVPSGGQNVTDAVARALQISSPEAEQVKREIGFGFQSAPGREAAVEAIDQVCRALIESVRNTFVYYGGNHGGAIEAVVLTGGGAHLPGLGQYLSSSTRMQVVLGDPLQSMKTARGFDRSTISGSESLAALPVGLAYGVAA